MVVPVHKRRLTEREITPLVGTLHEGTDESSNNHDPVHENYPQNSWPGHASSKKQIGEQQGSSQEPVDVSCVEDLSVDPGNSVIGPLKLNRNGSPAKVRSHREVCDRCDHGNTCSDVAEQVSEAHDMSSPWTLMG